MFISKESKNQTAQRLSQVIKGATLKVYDEPYQFIETDIQHFAWHDHALAFVRDDQVWSALVPSTNADAESFQIFRFHFTPGQDNSGFVGWLASLIKTKFGTGVFVLCGQNSAMGGIFGYWGAPLNMGDTVIAFIRELRDRS